jgi:hypothetical protein
MPGGSDISFSPRTRTVGQIEQGISPADKQIAAPPRAEGKVTEHAPASAAASHGYTLDQREDLAGGVQWVLDAIGTSIIVAIHPESRVCLGKYLDAETLDDAVAWSSLKSARGYNLYFQINQPKRGLSKKAHKADITHLRAWGYADIDAKDGRSHDEALASIYSLPLPPPNIIIATGGGYQPVWLLPEPIPATPDAITRVEALGERIASMAGGDSVENIDRILRLPFSRNFPNAKKRASGRVECLSGLFRIEACA